MVQCNTENFNKICKSIKVANSKSVDVKKVCIVVIFWYMIVLTAFLDTLCFWIYFLFQIPVLLHKTHDGSVPGFSSSLVNLAKSNNKQLLGDTLEEQALVRQWMDYAASSANYVDVPHVSKQVFKVRLILWLDISLYSFDTAIFFPSVLILFVFLPLTGPQYYLGRSHFCCWQFHISGWYSPFPFLIQSCGELHTIMFLCIVIQVWNYWY